MIHGELRKYFKTQGRFLGKYTVFYFFILCMILISCKKMSQNQPDNPHAVSFNPEVGSEYRYDVSEENEFVQQIGDIKGETVVSISRNIGFLYKVAGKSKNDYIVKVKFLSHDVVTAVTGVLNDTSVVDEAEPRLRKKDGLLGCEFSVRLQPDGQVMDIQGYVNYVAKCKLFQETALNEAFFKKMFSQISGVLPGNVVGIGSKWHREENPDQNIQYSTGEYRLAGIYGGIANVKKNALVRQELQVKQAPAEMNGTYHGDFEIELNSGMVLSSKSTRNLSGVTRIGDFEVTQVALNKYEIKGRKIG